MYLKLLFFMLIFISCSKGESTLMTKNKKNKNFKSLIKPDYLKSGDTIAIIAPSGVMGISPDNWKKYLQKKFSFCR